MTAEYDMNVPRVLIVDDVEANRFILKNIISDMGLQPILAENGVQALAVCQHFLPGIVLLDIAMPEMDGYEFCEMLKKEPETRDIPIIFITAYDDPKDIIKGFALGSEDYITKPFIPEVVKARVGVQLKLRDTRKNLQETNRKLKASVEEQLKQLEQEKKNVLYAVATVARKNSDYEEAHMERVRANCRILAQAMQLSEEYEHLISDTFVETIELAAPLCDVGNIAIPREVLQKTTKLTPEEVALIKMHPQCGADMLRKISAAGDSNDFMKMSIDIAQYHHENWDGSGYPNGVCGDEIPVSAQIVSVVGAYCALTERRSYREPYTKEEALEILLEGAGKQYNAQICQICKLIGRQLK